MTIIEWKRLARKRIDSGKMSVDEWDDVLNSLLLISEQHGVGRFDDAIEAEYGRSRLHSRWDRERLEMIRRTN